MKTSTTASLFLYHAGTGRNLTVSILNLIGYGNRSTSIARMPGTICARERLIVNFFRTISAPPFYGRRMRVTTTARQAMLPAASEARTVIVLAPSRNWISSVLQYDVPRAAPE